MNIIIEKGIKKYLVLLQLFSCDQLNESLFVLNRLVRSTLERAVWVRALAGDLVLCSWERHFTLTVPLFTQVYKWVPANCSISSRGE